MSYFGRGGCGNSYWYDTQKSNFLKEIYGKEFMQRGLSNTQPASASVWEDVPRAQLRTMAPIPYRSIPKWEKRQDIDFYNSRHTEFKNKALNRSTLRYFDLDITPKVGDLGDTKKSTMRHQEIEEGRYHRFVHALESIPLAPTETGAVWGHEQKEAKMSPRGPTDGYLTKDGVGTRSKKGKIRLPKKMPDRIPSGMKPMGRSMTPDEESALLTGRRSMARPETAQDLIYNHPSDVEKAPPKNRSAWPAMRPPSGGATHGKNEAHTPTGRMVRSNSSGKMLRASMPAIAMKEAMTTGAVPHQAWTTYGRSFVSNDPNGMSREALDKGNYKKKTARMELQRASIRQHMKPRN